MFGMDMAGSYDSRKIGRYEKNGLMVSTAMVTDSEHPYETAVQHPRYNGDKMVIVQEYDTKQAAQRGHNKWVKTMTAKSLPKQLKDISSAQIAQLCDMAGDWRDRPAKK